MNIELSEGIFLNNENVDCFLSKLGTLMREVGIARLNAMSLTILE